MLTFEQKRRIIESFPELERKDVSLGRVNYRYEGSVYDKKNIIYHLHPNGNGYVYAGQLSGVVKDDKGMVNIRDYTEEELRSLIAAAIRSLSPRGPEGAGKPPTVIAAPPSGIEASSPAERWEDPAGAQLTVRYDEENELWCIYASDSLEFACESHDEVEAYMAEEGFAKSR
jgi:hypothetical protein